jgi:hypothetical protein
MKRRGLIISGVAVIIAGVLALWALSRSEPREPVYQGRPLSQWILLLDAHTEHQAENDAARLAFLHLGQEAVPGLVRILHRRPDPVLVAKLKDLAIRLHLWRQPDIPLGERQFRAAKACCVLGEGQQPAADIRSAIPDLAYCFTNNVFHSIEPFCWAMVFAGGDGLSIVTNAMLKHPSWQIREEAAGSMWISRKLWTPEIVAVLMAATQDPRADVRVVSILSLQNFPSKTFGNLIVPGALRCLQDTNSEVRHWTVNLLGRYVLYPEVQTALTNMLADPDAKVQKAAEEIVQRIAEKQKP